METSVTQYLDSVGLNYRVTSHQNAAYACEDVARERGLRLSQIVKCMVGHDPKGGIHVMLIPGDKTLKLKRVRQIAGGTRIDLVPREILSDDFNLIIGAISPTQFVGQARFYMDNSIFREKVVDISSGEPNAGVELMAKELAVVLGAVLCDIISINHNEEVMMIDNFFGFQDWNVQPA
jgi:prolyl-tRNA editing enzyme YbaK/EbsC (Cys-tRNA(Pro) deacylase)